MDWTESLFLPYSWPSGFTTRILRKASHIMTQHLTGIQLRDLERTERIASCFSLAGTTFIFCTFMYSSAFRKPVNRLIFYATWGNILCNVRRAIKLAVDTIGLKSPADRDIDISIGHSCWGRFSLVPFSGILDPNVGLKWRYISTSITNCATQVPSRRRLVEPCSGHQCVPHIISQV